MATKATRRNGCAGGDAGQLDASSVEGVPVPTFEWMGLSAEWGTRIRPGEHGCG